MTHDSCRLRAATRQEEKPRNPWKVKRIAKRAIRFSMLLARHSALLAESRASDAARQHTRQIEAFLGEGGQGG